ncbi:MAG: thiamine pyrophosphate-dependent dehydrogenase E1 component subunit alpha [Rhizobiales bacterium]|nr:thiamine pyrophosphate-dependent dehydrogenase E1 component subunit alpha [Hyphomicrobiales bacterium]
MKKPAKAAKPATARGKAAPKAARARRNDAAPALTDADRVGLFQTMIAIREFEEQVQLSYLEGLVHGTTHLCNGQEAVAAGVCKALRDDDYVTYTYRGHGHCLARGMDIEAAFAELFGRETGVCGGFGGSMHLTDMERGLIGAFGIVGAGLPVAVGAGLSAQLAAREQVSVCFFGDGATNIGAFHEAMNMAQVWKLPVVFVCENNLYGEFSHISHTTPYEDLVTRAAGYAMENVKVDGNDVEAVYEAAAVAVARARGGGGPTFIECKTYRHRGHSRTDPAKYRHPDELAAWMKRDPIPVYRARLVKRGVITDRKADAIVAKAREASKAAAARAAAAAWPATGRDMAALTFA